MPLNTRLLFLFCMILLPSCSYDTEDVKGIIYLVDQKRLRIVESITRARVMKHSLCAFGLSRRIRQDIDTISLTRLKYAL